MTTLTMKFLLVTIFIHMSLFVLTTDGENSPRSIMKKIGEKIKAGAKIAGKGCDMLPLHLKLACKVGGHVAGHIGHHMLKKVGLNHKREMKRVDSINYPPPSNAAAAK